MSSSSSETVPASTAPAEPQGALEDIVTSILTPGYVGNTVWNILSVAVSLFCLVVVIRAWQDPSTFNLVSLFILIPAFGLLFSFKWLMSEMDAVRKEEAAKALQKDKDEIAKEDQQNESSSSAVSVEKAPTSKRRPQKAY